MKKMMAVALVLIFSKVAQIYAFDHKTKVHIEQSVIGKEIDTSAEIKLDLFFKWDIEKKDDMLQLKGRCINIKGAYQKIVRETNIGTRRVIAELDWSEGKDIRALKQMISKDDYLSMLTHVAEIELQYTITKTGEVVEQKIVPLDPFLLTTSDPFNHQLWGMIYLTRGALLGYFITIPPGIEKNKTGDIIIDEKSTAPDIFDTQLHVKVSDVSEDTITLEMMSKSKPGKRWTNAKGAGVTPPKFPDHLLEAKVIWDYKENKPVSAEGVLKAVIYNPQGDNILGEFNQKIAVKVEND